MGLSLFKALCTIGKIGDTITMLPGNLKYQNYVYLFLLNKKPPELLPEALGYL